MKLIINDLLLDKLGRVDSPVAKKLIDLKGTENENLNISYLGISQQNPTYISYLDAARVARIDSELIKPIYKFEGLKVKFKGNGFNSENGTATLHSLDPDFPQHWEDRFREEFYDAFSVEDSSFVGSILDTAIECANLEEGKAYFMSLINPESVFLLRTNDIFNYHTYLKFKDIVLFCEVSVVLSTETPDIETLLYDPKKRYHASAGKVARRILGELGIEGFDDKTIEYFVGMYKLESFKECGDNGDYIYEEVKGEDIRWSYHENNYYDLSSELGSSCMRYSHCQNYLDIYVENPEVISLGVLKQRGKIAARSLIWNVHDNSKIIHDRIYGYNEETKIILKAKFQTLNYYDAYNGSESFQVNLKHTRFDRYPYMDTFRYLNLRGYIYNNDHEYDYCLDCADGYHSNSEVCDCCGDEVDRDDLNEITRGRGRGNMYCNNCSTYLEDGDTVHFEDAVYCEYIGGYYHQDDVVELTNGNYAHNDDTRELHDGRYCLREDAIELYNGEYEHKDYVTQAVDGNYYSNDNIEDFCVLFEGNYYLHDHEKVEYVPDLSEWLHIESSEYINYQLQNIKENEQTQEPQESEQINAIKENETIQETSIESSIELINTQENNEFIL